jgi:hypothetical protein
MANTPQEKAKPAITVVASASSLMTRQPAQAHDEAVKRRLAKMAAKIFIASTLAV